MLVSTIRQRLFPNSKHFDSARRHPIPKKSMVPQAYNGLRKHSDADSLRRHRREAPHGDTDRLGVAGTPKGYSAFSACNNNYLPAARMLSPILKSA